jgi:hypothetical protein
VKTPLLVGILLIAAGCAAPGISPTAAPPTSSPPPSPSASASPAATPGAQPPNALLSVAGGAPVAGALGTYTWLGTGSDAPWLPGTPVKAGPGAAATVVLDPPIATTSWTVRWAKPGDTNGLSARPVASGAGAIAFTIPPEAGSLALQVQFAADAGDANYFWALSP